MKKLSLIFTLILVIIGGYSAWYLFGWQPANLGKEVENGHNQNSVTGYSIPLSTFMAKGTEPFWSLELTGTNLVWQAPGGTGVDTMIYTGITQTSSGSSYVITDGSMVTVMLVPGTCSDGMSENTYTGSAIVLFATGPQLPQYNGCANW